MRRHVSRYGVTIVLAALAAETALAQDQIPCLDLRQDYHLIDHFVLTFHGPDGRTVSRTNLNVRQFVVAEATVIIEDAGEVRPLRLAEWSVWEIRIKDISFIAQQAHPAVSSFGSVGGRKVPLDSVKISDGLVTFKDCVDMTGSDREGVKFDGTLTFNVGANSLTLDGWYKKYVIPPDGPINPGVSK